MKFLPVSKEEIRACGWDQPDFILVTGDAYVDHPSFGAAVVGRVLESAGYRVAVLPQPDWKSDDGFLKLGHPKLGFFVTGGNIDSMVAHYTAAKRKRSEDYYSAGKRMGKRPDRAVITYCQGVRRQCGGVPIIIGGLEASLRRFAHYDYWDDVVRPSILVDSNADILVYGMGELQTIEIAKRLANGEPINQIRDIRGTCYITKEAPVGAVECPSYGKILESKQDYAEACALQYREQDAVRGKTLIQLHGNNVVVQNPPMRPLSQPELDRYAELPYMRAWHPVYDSQGGVPAIEEVEFSIIHNRGCFGGCNFCSIAFHQGQAVTARSVGSVVREAKLLTEKPNFKGYIHDVGGPTANFRKPSCQEQKKRGLCANRKCLAPKPCPSLKADHREYVELLRKLRELPKVKKVFIRSGIRFDYLMQDKDDTFFRELVQHHVSGQLKVAPEHCSNAVLDRMGKPHIEAYKAFAKKFYAETKRLGKKQYLVPYLISSHPGSSLRQAVELALFLKREKIRPEQVQDFYPTPGTVSTCMFHTGLDPFTMQAVHIPRTPGEKAQQRALLQYFNPKNYWLVHSALKECGRTDLIGIGKDALIPPPGRRTPENRK